MPHRFTMKELSEMSDETVLQFVLSDRTETLTNIYSPTYKRLMKIHNRLDRCKLQENKP